MKKICTSRKGFTYTYTVLGNWVGSVYYSPCPLRTGVTHQTMQSFRQVTGSHILRVQIYLRAYYTRAHSRRRPRDSHYHLLCSIPMPYTSVGLEYRFSIHFGRTKQKNGDELRTLRSLRTSQTDPSKIDRAYGTCVNFFSLGADPTKFFPLKVAR